MQQAPLHAQRTAAADAAYEAYDFGDMVGEADGWMRTDPGREWTRNVYLEPPNPTRHTVTTKVTFVVRFTTDESSVVEEAYVAGW